MSDNLKAIADQFKAAATAAKTPNPDTDKDNESSDLDAAIENALNTSTRPTPKNTTSPVTPPPKATPKKPTKPPAATATGAITINMPPPLEQLTREAADHNDLWHIEYIRAAIETYGPQIPNRPPGPRRRNRSANSDPARTYKLGTSAKRQLEQAANKTGRSQTNAFKVILQMAVDNNYQPAPID